ncbi:MAG: hypothetical protein GX752_08850 [Clostridium sp.]|nr:hypothetical protein [Clostridium sp.]
MDNFKKCDLHIHSSSCYSRNYSKKDFLKTLNKIDIDVVSITDHNIIDVDLYEKIDRDIDIGLIGGVELNLAINKETIEKYELITKSDYFHAIMWFSLKDIKKAWENLKTVLMDKGIDVTKNIREISKNTKGKFFYLNDIHESFQDINYYLIHHENKGDRNLSDYLPNKYKQNLEFKSKLLYYNNTYGVEGGKKSSVVTNYMENDLETLVSKFLFSDAKELKDIGEKFTWINFDGNFDSIKLAVSDPSSRLFTSDEQKNNPQKNLNNYLEKIRITTSSKSKKKLIEIDLSPGYNGIIGSRGSGKTMLASILSMQNISVYKDFIDNNLIEYKLSNKSEFQKHNPNNLYLSQNSLLNMYENGSIKDIDFIENYYARVEKEKQDLISKNTLLIKKTIECEKQKIYKFINEKTFNLKDLNFLKNEVDEKFMIKKFSKKDIKLPSTIVTEGKEEVIEFNDKIENLSLPFVKPDANSKLYTELSDYTSLVNKFLKDIKILIEEIEEKNKDLINKIEKTKTKNFILREKYIDNYVKNLEEKNIGTSDSTVEHLELKSQALNQLDKIYLLRYSLKNIHEYNKERINEIRNKKTIERTLLEGKPLNISTTVVEKNEYDDFVSTQYKNNKEFTNEEWYIKALLNYSDFSEFSKFFNGTKYKKNIASSQIKIIDKFYSNLDTYINEYSDFSIKLEYNGKDLDKYSPGNKTEILLDMFLHDIILDGEATYLVLDQPEDNIDTKTITKKLIKKLRDLKFSKQLFVVSHSAAVIINGDADNIIYAEDNKGLINYEFGSISKKDMKKNIVTTLDGGEKNLKMRLNKYDFDMEDLVND